MGRRTMRVGGQRVAMRLLGGPAPRISRTCGMNAIVSWATRGRTIRVSSEEADPSVYAWVTQGFEAQDLTDPDCRDRDQPSPGRFVELIIELLFEFQHGPIP